MAIQVLLTDDHPAVREGLALLLQSHPDIAVVGMAADGGEAVQQALQQGPDVVVMDITMAVLNGIEATEQIRERCPGTRVVILSVHGDAEHVFRAFRAGALGYVRKEAAGREITDAVRTVHAGKCYLGATIVDTVIEDYVRQRHAPNPLESLSAREQQVLRLLLEGHTSAEVAEMLALPPASVAACRSRTMQKLGLGDAALPVTLALGSERRSGDRPR
ncbi:response regulator transcription factor [Azoarcus sp. DN11]|uniref:response regulator transcription factor n=1 Tax=Azoarcus sp. DN11 TaxID=356837 RepID=UPI000EB1E05F|nr:response regulator transcription factor [Azoarcus sp. DN11]AYH45612.1 hypothetical protein CDA09_19880 [Azoarcus sp. DN11]